MGKTKKFDETYIFEISKKSDSFDVSTGIKIPFLEFRLLLSQVTPYLQFVTTNCLKETTDY
jgi:hypothetical protein